MRISLAGMTLPEARPILEEAIEAALTPIRGDPPIVVDYSPGVGIVIKLVGAAGEASAAATSVAGTQFWAVLGSSTSIGDNRWSYTFTEQMPDANGLYKDKPDGLSGTAYNTVESNNAASGIQGNGVDVSGGPVLLPIGAGAVVLMYAVLNCEDPPEVEYHFQAENQWECPE